MSSIKADPSISIIGGLLIWTGWLFMTCAAGYNIVDFDEKHVPQKIAMNVMMSAAGAGITNQLFNLGLLLVFQFVVKEFFGCFMYFLASIVKSSFVTQETSLLEVGSF